MSQAELIKVWEMPGGVHPPQNKAQSMQLPLGEVSIPKELIFPVSQHIGSPAKPIVNVGDKIKGGEKIADATGPMSVPIHASTSGVITAIDHRALPHASGMTGLCIILESDGKHEFANTTPWEDYQQHSPIELVEKIREAGIAGLGGAGFPTAIKLAPRTEAGINTLIINGTECEPYITADDRLMQDFADEIVAGAQLLAYILGNPERVIIGIEDNKPDAITAIQHAIRQQNISANIELATFPTKYPSGGEKQLIQIVTGQEVPSGQIPASLGIVVQNIGTTFAAYRAVRYGEPLTWRITTVVGESLSTQRNIKALLGTPVQHILKEHGFQPDTCSRLIMGGPMMGFALPNAGVPIVKTTNCLIAPTHEEMPEPPSAQPCIRCGLCAEACPVSLLPQQLYWYSKAEDYDRLQNHNLFDCIECGACSYVCPSAIPLVQYYRAAKGTIRHQEQEKIKSDHARQRFEFRKQRMERAEKEKETKRLARKKAAEEAKRLAAEKQKTASKSPEADPVAAAMARLKEKEQDPAAQQAKLERAVSSAKSRVEKLQTKHREESTDQLDKLQAQLKQAEVRLLDAEKNLADFRAKQNNEEKHPAPETATNPDDAASAAIAKAKEKAASMAQMSPEEKLKNQVNSLKTRVEKARKKLAQAEQEGSEHIDALRSGLEKLEAKLATTQTELEKL